MVVFVDSSTNMNDERVFRVDQSGVGTIERVKWNLIFMFLSSMLVLWCRSKMTDSRGHDLHRNSIGNIFICFRTTEQTLTIFGRNFPNEVWHSSHMTSDILMVNIWRFFSQQHLKGFECILYYMYLLMRRSWLIFHGSKHGGMNIYFVIYLEKIQKHISKKIVGSKVVRTS
jgi:hypothetical protein